MSNFIKIKFIFINFIFQNFIFINIINFTIQKYITIPFNIIHKDEPDSFSSLNDYFNYWSEMEFYGEISIGTPPQKIETKLTFEDYGVSILNKGCDYYIPSSDINAFLNLQNSSSSFNIYNDSYYGIEIFYYKKSSGTFYALDNFYFDSMNYKQKSNNEIIEVNNLKFIYSPQDNKQICTCLNIGFKAYCRNLRESSINFVSQIKKFGIIKSYDWSIIFDNKTKYPEKGIFLIGARPDEYIPESYNENDLFGSGSISNEVTPYYNFQIHKIYFQPNLNGSDKIYITDVNELQLIPTYGLIKASRDYESKISIFFFDYFISENKCYKEYKFKDNEDSFRTFVCYNTENIKKELKEKFPVLKMTQINFAYTFELNYDDLFKEKGDKIYFLIWFHSLIADGWEIGYPFLKKYLFVYNNDNKNVFFYNHINNEEDNGSGLSSDNSKIIIKIIIIIVLIIIATIIGFFIGKLFSKKKKKEAKEMESEALFEDNN